MEKRLIPELRFPTYEDEWKSDLVNNRAVKLNVGFVGTCEPYYTNKENGVLLVRTGNLKGVDIVLDEVKYVTADFHKKNIKSQLYPDDLLLARHGGKGEICLVPKKFPTANCLNIVILRINNTIDSKFFQLIYGANSIQRQILAVTAGSTQTVINTREIGLLKFKFPSLPEQQKIASFLSSVDKRIELLQKKKDLLEDYKKGVMQKLFSQEIPFKDDNGNDFPDWEEKRVGEVLKERNKKSVKSQSYPLMSFMAGKGVAPKGERYNREFLVNDSDNKKYKQTEYGDFIYSSNNLETGSIGLNKYGSATISPVYSIFQIDSACDINFIEAYFTRKAFIYKMVRFRQGVVYGQWRIHESEFLKIKELIPSLAEQQKIASFLSAIDSKIETTTQQIEGMQTFKKGLLQQMFV